MAIDRGYFRSAPFLVALVVALVLVGTGLATWAAFGGRQSVFSAGGCTAPSLAGAPISVTPTIDSPDETHRTITWTLPANGTTGGQLRACIGSGGLLVKESPDADAHVIARLQGDADYIAATRIDAAFARAGAGIAIAAWQSREAATTGFGFHPSGGASIEVQLPSTGRFDGDASADSGELQLEGGLWGNLTLSADSGTITARGNDVAGNSTLSVDSGEITFQPSSLGPGRIHATADSGTLTLALPQRADIGYDATGTADSGSVAIDLGPTELYEKDDHHVRAVTKDYASKPTQIQILATVDSGEVDMRAA